MTNTRLLIRIALLSIINLPAAVPMDFKFLQTYKMEQVDIPTPDEMTAIYHNGDIIAELIIPRPEDQTVVMKAVTTTPGKYNKAYYVAFDHAHQSYRIPFEIEFGKGFVPDFDVADELCLIHLEKDKNVHPPSEYQELMEKALTGRKQALQGRNRDADDFEMGEFSTDKEIRELEFWWRLRNPGPFLIQKLRSLRVFFPLVSRG